MQMEDQEEVEHLLNQVAHSPVHESEKDILNREGNPSQSLNEDNTKAKSDNVVEDAGQSSKVDDNEGGADVCLKEAESTYTDKVQEEDRHNTAAEIDEGIRDELLKKAKLDITSEYRYTTVNCMFKNYIHDTYTYYHRSQYEIDFSSQEENVHSMKVTSVERSICEIIQGLYISAAYAEYLSDGHQIPSLEFDPEMYRTIYTSLLWGYGLNKASNEYDDDNQDPPRSKRTFIPSEDTEMIDVEM
ncbi:hypothetical protein BC332_07002 [Capsicum chinense]|nr:hypothetical protein BC332_07002 [Capsicum chinense]